METWLSLWSLGQEISESDLEKVKDTKKVEGVEVWGEHVKAKEYLDLSYRLGLKTGLHLPFHDLNLATPEEGIAKRTMAVLSDWLKRLGDRGAEHAVLHGGYAWASENRPEALVRVAERLNILRGEAKTAGVDLLLENLIPDQLPYTHTVASTVSEWQNLLTEAGVGACLDIGHLAISGEDRQETIRLLGNNLHSVHYSDNDARADWHLLPGDGEIASGLMTALDTEDYSGIVVYEINPYRYSTDDILERIKRGRTD
jgi:sugar phosphate isomerase/epimerase